jgi:hypothetical protein
MIEELLPKVETDEVHQAHLKQFLVTLDGRIADLQAEIHSQFTSNHQDFDARCTKSQQLSDDITAFITQVEFAAPRTHSVNGEDH